MHSPLEGVILQVTRPNHAAVYYAVAYSVR